MLIYSPKDVSNCVGIRPDDYRVPIVPIDRPIMSRAEKEFNKIIKHIGSQTSVFDDNFDPFLSYLFESNRFMLKFNKKSSSLVFNHGSWGAGRHISVISLQHKRNTILKEFPFRHMMFIEKTKNIELNRFLGSILEPDQYFVMSLGHKEWSEIACDVYFRTEESFKKFMNEYVIGKLSCDEVTYNLKHSLRQVVFGSNLKNLLSDWKEIHVIGGTNFGSTMTALFKKSWAEAYFDKLQTVHDWCDENLEKKFLLMGWSPEIWMFESQEDLDYFKVRWS